MKTKAPVTSIIFFILQILIAQGTPVTVQTDEGETWETFMKNPIILRPKNYFYNTVILGMNQATAYYLFSFYGLDKSETGSLPFDEWLEKQISHLSAETIAPEDKHTLAEVAYLAAWQEKFGKLYKNSEKLRSCTKEKSSESLNCTTKLLDQASGKEVPNTDEDRPEIPIAGTVPLPEGETWETIKQKPVILRPKTFFYDTVSAGLVRAAVYPMFLFYMQDKSEVGSLPFNEWVEKQMVHLTAKTIDQEDKQTLAEVNYLKVWQLRFNETYNASEKFRLCTKQKYFIVPPDCLMTLINQKS